MSYVTRGNNISILEETKEITSKQVKCTGYPTICGEKKIADDHTDIDFRKPSEIKKDQKIKRGIQLCRACSAAFHEERRKAKRADKDLSNLCQQIEDVKGSIVSISKSSAKAI